MSENDSYRPRMSSVDIQLQDLFPSEKTVPSIFSACKAQAQYLWYTAEEGSKTRAELRALAVKVTSALDTLTGIALDQERKRAQWAQSKIVLGLLEKVFLLGAGALFSWYFRK